jgi:hypothetical protein
MNSNAFDKGYEIVWIGHGRAHIKRIPDLPIVEVYKLKCIDDFTGEKISFWNLRPLAMTDEKIDDALPKNWRDKSFAGFRKFQELEDWLRS